MASPFSSDIPKPGSTEKLANQVNKALAPPPPAFGDLGKAANDVREYTAMAKGGTERLTDVRAAYQQGLLPHCSGCAREPRAIGRRVGR